MSWYTAFSEVVRDLVIFMLPARKPVVAIPPRPVPKMLPAVPPVELLLGEEKQTNQTIVSTQTGPDSVLYVAKNEARLWQRPVVLQDGVVGHIPYGQAVSVKEYAGRFALVSWRDLVGYVLKDDLENLKEALFPIFHEGEIYNSNHPDTKKLRRLIKDDFATESLALPLQSAEFVTYRLAEDKRTLPWGSERPRTPGLWHNLLKGKPGVQIGISPKTGAVMEYQKEDGTGFVGYTKAVLADETIVVEGIGRIIEGEYLKEEFSKKEWHEWRPVWISVT